MFVLKNPARLFQSYRDFCFFLFCSKQFLYTDKFYTEYEDFCCLCKFLNCREGRCNTDIAVFWILSVWEGCSRFCQDQSGFFCFCYDCFCTSIQRIEGNEVSSSRCHPGTNLKSASSLSSTLNTVSNFGLKISACFFIC